MSLVQSLNYHIDATILITDAVNQSPRAVLPRFMKGNIFHMRGMIVEAIEAYRQTLEIQPDFQPSLTKLDEVCLMFGTVNIAELTCICTQLLINYAKDEAWHGWSLRLVSRSLIICFLDDFPTSICD